MPAGYVTAFEVSRSADWPFALLGPGLVVAGVVLAFLKLRFRWQQPVWALPAFLSFFGLAATCLLSIGTIWPTFEAYRALQSGDYSRLEGVVTDFQPMPYEGHRHECFSVQGHTFCYSDYGLTAGFHQSASHGGPIREGLQVRIAHRGDLILKLEVPADSLLAPQQQSAVAAQNEKTAIKKMDDQPDIQRMQTAFLIAAIGWTLWWNLQWKRVMRFWLKPPYRPLTEKLFRTFFAANLVGAVIGASQQLYRNPPLRTDIFPLAAITASMLSVIFLMSFGILYLAERRDRKEQAIVAMR